MPTCTTGDGYPLSIVELTRWNSNREGGREHLGCPQHRSPQPLVAGEHETTGDPIWICVECGYITPILDEELRNTLGATETFTAQARTANLEATTRYVLLPAHPASRPVSGHVAIADRSRSRLSDYAGAGIGVAVALTILCLTRLPVYGVLILLISAAILGAAGGAILRNTRTGRALAVTDRLVAPAAHVLPGQWISREVTMQLPVQPPSESLLYVQWIEGPAPAPQLNSKRLACRVLQNTRVGNTASVRITTTAGTFTTADTTPITVVQMADPALNDFTYYPRG